MADPSADMKKFLPEQYLQVIGKNLPGLITAVNESVAKTETQVQAIIDQLFLTTASGRYLVQLGEEKGFVMPANSGLDIRSYRVLVPIMVSDPKQVRITIDQLVQAFYGSERTKPNVLSSVPGSYSLLDGDNLIIETESGESDVSVTLSQVSDLNDVSAGEVTAILNSSQSLYLATVVKNRTTGLDFIRITSKTPGAGAFVRIAGGTLQNVLKFPILAETVAQSGTTWTLTKTSTATDELKFTWDGTPPNPNVYKAKAGDIVTLRGFTDGVDNFSQLNGSYSLVDVGYDYFIIRNEGFASTSSSVAQPDDNSVVFTKNEQTDLFDNDEYALTTESGEQTITITVPAVPPLARRFLSGSAHLHGNVNAITDFTRTTLQIAVESDQEKPQGDNTLIITNGFMRADMTRKHFKSTQVTSSTTAPIYAITTGEDDRDVFPFTVPSGLGTNPLAANLLKEEITVTFPFKHGMRKGWQMTLAGFIGSQNFTAINGSHVVKDVIDEYTLTFRLFDANGIPLVYQGVAFGPCDVTRHSVPQSNGADFFMTFPSPAAALASGLQPGTAFRFNTSGGVNVSPFYSNLLRFRTMSVTEINGANIHFSAGAGTGPEGSIMTGVSGRRSESAFGSTAGTYFFDKTSQHNVARVMTDLYATFTGYTPSSNEDYVGSFLYDPSGEKTSTTVSQYLAQLNTNVFKGAAQRALFVDEPTEGFPETGEIIIDYGTDEQEGPIRFSAFIKNPGNYQVLIDPAYKFKFSHDIGSRVQFIHARQPYTPKIEGQDYPFYLTGTASARNTMFALVELLIASGFFVEANVLLPELRYSDPSIEPFL